MEIVKITFKFIRKKLREKNENSKGRTTIWLSRTDFQLYFEQSRHFSSNKKDRKSALQAEYIATQFAGTTPKD